MNSFSINRFGKTLRWVVSVNFRKLLMWSIGVAMVVFAVEMIMLKTNQNTSPYSMVSGFAALSMLLLGLASLILTSSIVSSINEKRKREAFLMLPSTNIEKYLSLLVYTTFISIACIFLAVVVGDSMRVLWAWASGYTGEKGVTHTINHAGKTFYWWSSIIPQIWHNLTSSFPSNGDFFIYNEGHSKQVEICTNGYLIVRYVFAFASVVWIHSLFLLGGTLLRKYAFVVSGVVFMFAMWLYAEATINFHLNLYEYKYFVEYGREGFDYYETAVRMVNSSIAGIVLVLLLAFSCFNYWASYHIFKGFQLISNKWTNYDILKR